LRLLLVVCSAKSDLGQFYRNETNRFLEILNKIFGGVQMVLGAHHLMAGNVSSKEPEWVPDAL
jgi:hypothetical protein